LKVLFICRGKNGSRVSPFIRAQGESLIKRGIELDFYMIKNQGLFGYLQSSVRLRKHLKSFAIDILHAHYGMSAWATWIARRKEKIVVSFMGDDIIGSNKADGSVTKTSLLLARVNSFLARRFYDHVIVKSEAMLKQLDVSNVSLIPNGVDLITLKPKRKAQAKTELEMDPRERMVVFVSDPSRVEKNYPLARNAVKLLNNPEVKLVPVFNQSHECLSDYYNAADVLLLTSFHEGSPNVIKEAMACNCPIVSTAVGDVQWIFGETEGCFLTSFKVEDVADKLSMALAYAQKKDRTKGRDRIIELGLDSESIAKKIIAIYKQVLN
jgi:teichuronic acid biosynthesis glycosyltransferase TuaC